MSVSHQQQLQQCRLVAAAPFCIIAFGFASILLKQKKGQDFF